MLDKKLLFSIVVVVIAVGVLSYSLSLWYRSPSQTENENLGVENEFVWVEKSVIIEDKSFTISSGGSESFVFGADLSEDSSIREPVIRIVLDADRKVTFTVFGSDTKEKWTETLKKENKSKTVEEVNIKKWNYYRAKVTNNSEKTVESTVQVWVDWEEKRLQE